MHVTRIIPFVLIGVLLAVVGSDSAFTQMPGGDRQRAFEEWLNKSFHRFSGGKDEIDVATSTLPEKLRTAGQAFLRSKGVNDGKMTRELFREYYFALVRNKQAAQAGGAPAATSGASADETADRFFDRYSGGKEEFDVASSALPERTKAGILAFLRSRGVNDGKLTRELFRLFYAAVLRSRQAAQGGNTPQTSPGEAGRPTVYRRGKLPKGLPPWFAQLDRDGDAQVGLYEWMAAGRAVDEFVAMDLNGDGFLTAEEVLRYQKAQKK
jgi:hypothetical protein